MFNPVHLVESVSGILQNIHVPSIVSKACKPIHYLRVYRTAHLPRNIGVTTYITKIRPVLEYASPVWGGLPIYLEEDLQRVHIVEVSLVSLGTLLSHL